MSLQFPRNQERTGMSQLERTGKLALAHEIDNSVRMIIDSVYPNDPSIILMVHEERKNREAASKFAAQQVTPAVEARQTPVNEPVELSSVPLTYDQGTNPADKMASLRQAVAATSKPAADTIAEVYTFPLQQVSNAYTENQ